MDARPESKHRLREAWSTKTPCKGTCKGHLEEPMALSRLTLSLAVVAGLAAPAYAKDVKNVGISVGLLGNPFFVATIKGIEAKAKEITPGAKITSVSADYDL